jgi:hypothetical protein
LLSLQTFNFSSPARRNMRWVLAAMFTMHFAMGSYVGLLLGLAGLAKYTAVLFAAAVGVCLLVTHGWRLLGNPRLWMAVMLALALV